MKAICVVKQLQFAYFLNPLLSKSVIQAIADNWIGKRTEANNLK